MRLLDTLQLSPRGRSWLRVLPNECKEALYYIEDKLDASWNNNTCYPQKNKTLLPFHLIAPEEVVLVIICKEPYASTSMATGIPVETNNRLETASVRVFRDLISRYWTNIDNNNFMKCYYVSGILVINSSFTIGSVHDKRYSLAQSHFPLWTRFCHPLVRYLNSKGICILGLGSEAKGLLRNSSDGNIVRSCPFPMDHITTATFMELAKSLIDSNVFRVTRTRGNIL